MPEWFEDVSFWRELYPFMFSEERFEAAQSETDKIVELLDFKGSTVLDLCCGPGRFAIPLAQRGYGVTGVDRTALLLDKARAKAEAAGLRIEWVEADMREFARPNSFDLALSMFTSFGYFDDRSEDTRVLSQTFLNLRPGGCLVMDIVGKEILARIFQPTSCQQLADGSMLVERHEIFDHWTRIRNEWILLRDDKAKTFRFHHTIYSGQELMDRLEDVGFSDVHLFGDLDGTEYGPEASRLVAVARK